MSRREVVTAVISAAGAAAERIHFPLAAEKFRKVCFSLYAKEALLHAAAECSVVIALLGCACSPRTGATHLCNNSQLSPHTLASMHEVDGL